MYQKFLYLSLGIKKIFMLVVNFFLEIFFTHFTSYCPKCLFNWNNHKDPAGSVISVEIIARWNKSQRNIYKKKYIDFIIPRPGFSHFRQLLQIPGLKEMSGFPRSPIYSVNNLRSTALVSNWLAMHFFFFLFFISFPGLYKYWQILSNIDEYYPNQL